VTDLFPEDVFPSVGRQLGGAVQALSRVVMTPFGAMFTSGGEDTVNVNEYYDSSGEVYRFDPGTGRWTRLEEVSPYTEGTTLGPQAAAGTVAKTRTEFVEVGEAEVPPSVKGQAKRINKQIAAAKAQLVSRRYDSRPNQNRNKLPASEGGQLNDPDFLGAEYLRDELGFTDAEVAAYSTNVPKPPFRPERGGGRQSFVRGETPKFAGSMTANYYAQMHKAGFGRPQYALDDAASILNMPARELRAWQSQMMYLDIPGASSIVFGTPDPATISAYKFVLTQANLSGVPASTMISRMIADKAAYDQADERGILPGSDGSGSRVPFDPVKKKTIINLTGKGQARTQLRQMMAQLLGRKPTPSEVEAYLARLNTAEENDPTVVTARYTRDGDVTTTTDRSDVDPTQIARKEIKGDNPKEYKQYQSLQYYNIIADMMGQ
jgi:hypothetical protein